MATAKRMKSKASVYVPQSREEVANDIRVIGDLQRESTRLMTHLNDEIARITAVAQPSIDDIKTRVDVLQEGVRTWCEANRATLTHDGKVKTANLLTGEVQWRQRPPSVGVRGAETVLETLKRMALERFVRTKEEINKEAILNEPDAVRGIAGITINTGVEDFVITPFEQEAS